jgi:hypothetical protein
MRTSCSNRQVSGFSPSALAAVIVVLIGVIAMFAQRLIRVPARALLGDVIVAFACGIRALALVVL